MKERDFPAKTYTFKWLRRTQRGSFTLMNKGVSQYRREEGVYPTALVLSTLRRETLPVPPMPQEYSDGTKFMYGFSEGLQLNQIECSRRSPLEILSEQDMRALAVHIEFTVERWVKEIFDEGKNQI